MRVTLLGHASLLVEMSSATCLMDPVFFDPFEEGAVTSCPRRTVFPEALPDIDLLVVSHRHPDHFDLRSLDRVPRDCDAVCPADPVIVYALEQLGFDRVHPAHPMAEISTPDFELFPTRSELTSIPEMGMVFHDGTGTVWNQVDSILTHETIDAVVERFGHLDVHLAMYASQNFDFFESRAAELPLEEHRSNVEHALRAGARTVVPGSAGFRFAGELEWLNPFLFPISRERFAADLEQASPGVDVRTMDPGDVLEVEGGEARLLAGESPAARSDEDDSHRIRFEPTAAIPPLEDPGLGDHSPEALRRELHAVVEGLAAWARSTPRGEDQVLDAYRRLGASFALEVVDPRGDASWWCLRFHRGDVELTEGEGSLPVEADVVHRIAATVLVEWARYRTSFFYARGFSRRRQSSYLLQASGSDVEARSVPLPDLLIHHVHQVAPGSERAEVHLVDRTLEAIRTTTPA